LISFWGETSYQLLREDRVDLVVPCETEISPVRNLEITEEREKEGVSK